MSSASLQSADCKSGSCNGAHQCCCPAAEGAWPKCSTISTLLTSWCVQGFLLALDKSERRLKALQRMAVQQGVTDIVHCQAADLRHYASCQLGSQAAPAAPGAGSETEAGLFDRVLLDAPCSGLGVLAKRWVPMRAVRQEPANTQLMLTSAADLCRADLRWRRHAGEITELTQLQVRRWDSVTVAAHSVGKLCMGPQGCLLPLGYPCRCSTASATGHAPSYCPRRQGAC